MIHCPRCALGVIRVVGDREKQAVCDTCKQAFHRGEIHGDVFRWEVNPSEFLSWILEAAESVEWQELKPSFNLAVQPTFVAIIGEAMDGTGQRVVYAPLPGSELEREFSDSDLAATLVDLDFPRWMQVPGWQDALSWGGWLNKGDEIVCTALKAWYDRYRDNVRVVDFILFHVPMRYRCGIDVLQQWKASAIALAKATHDESLVETLIYRIGDEIRGDPELWQLALALRANPRVNHALQERGSVSDEAHEARLRRDTEKATENLFGAIRRHDVSAVRALLGKAPDLTATDADGLTAAQLARTLGHDDLYQMVRDAANAG